MDQSYFFRKTSFLNRRQQIWGVSKCCWLLDLQWLCFLKSPPCKPYLKRRRHTEYRGKKGSLKLDTCFKAWYFLYRKTDLHQIWTKKDEFIIAGYISSAKSVYQISVCSGQVKGLLRYHCLHSLIVSWQGWSTGISRSQLAGTTINWETLILLWFFQKKKKKTVQLCLSKFRLQCYGVKWDKDLEWHRTWNMASRREMQEYIDYIFDVTGQKEYNLSMPEVYIIK